MTLAVEFETGPAPGRRLRVEEGQPRSLRVLYQGQEAGQVVFEIQHGRLRMHNRSGRPVTVNGNAMEQADLEPGDRLMIGKDSAVVVLDEDTTQAASTDSQRRRRAISAEGVAPSASSGRQGLITRVSTALATRAERGREEELQRQRLELLTQVGRRALEGERFGLPAAAMQDLLAGRSVRLDPANVDRQAMDWWRQARDRLALIDAEIGVLRKIVGLPPDPGAATPPVIRQDLRKQEERTYQALDNLATQNLETLPAFYEEDRGSSGRRRTPPLRRRRS